MQRIRYSRSRTDAKLLSSTRYIIVEGKSYKVMLHEGDLTWTVFNGAGELVAEGAGATAHDIRIRAKEHLEGLGAKFEEEKRK